HQEMVNDVGGLPNEALAVVADSRNRSLDGFLAELLGALVDAAIEQFAGIGHLGALAGALPHALFQIADREIRQLHVLPSGFHISSPAQPGEADYGPSRTGRPA